MIPSTPSDSNSVIRFGSISVSRMRCQSVMCTVLISAPAVCRTNPFGTVL